MDRDEEAYGSANPDAPAELSQFAFLIGRWRCDARLKLEDGSWEPLEASWVGRYILDGYAIMDEFRMKRPMGELLVLGVNVRAYDVKKRAWTLRWLNAFDGTWVDLGPEELGGVEVDGQSISYTFKEPIGGHALTRATYLDISPSHFTWRGEKSSDGKAWEEFLVIEAHRIDE
ncbi:MAG: hypothetical protein ACRD2Z_04655 [Thermoanaerobaculia bacterium]